MRYIKVLILAIFFFLALVFLFQNQAPLSQEMQLTINLLFIPPFTSIPLPFYFLLISAFLLGCLLSLAFLVWDKCSSTAKIMRNKMQIKSLQKEVDRCHVRLDEINNEKAALPPASDSAEAKK